MVVVSCAIAIVKANALIAPIAKILLNLLSFMFVLCFVKRMLPVVTNLDWSRTGLIQPHKWFVNSKAGGRFCGHHAHVFFLVFEAVCNR
jgi:hypothetical protein